MHSPATFWRFFFSSIHLIFFNSITVCHHSLVVHGRSWHYGRLMGIYPQHKRVLRRLLWMAWGVGISHTLFPHGSHLLLRCHIASHLCVPCPATSGSRGPEEPLGSEGRAPLPLTLPVLLTAVTQSHRPPNRSLDSLIRFPADRVYPPPITLTVQLLMWEYGNGFTPLRFT